MPRTTLIHHADMLVIIDAARRELRDGALLIEGNAVTCQVTIWKQSEAAPGANV